MNPERLKQQLDVRVQRQPFRPFKIVLVSGGSVPVTDLRPISYRAGTGGVLRNDGRPLGAFSADEVMDVRELPGIAA